MVWCLSIPAELNTNSEAYCSESINRYIFQSIDYILSIDNFCSRRQHTKIPERQRLKVSTSERQKLPEDPVDHTQIHYQYTPGE